MTAADTPPTDLTPKTTPEAAPLSALSADDFDTLDALLDDVRTREPQTPQWEFCEGFLAAVVCCRDPISDEAALDQLLPEFTDETPLFADAAQKAQFMALWARRRIEIAISLATEVESLTDDRAFSPEVMDSLGALLTLPPEEYQAWMNAQDNENNTMPSYAQVWALGFMAGVEAWPESWAAPRDPDTASWFNEALETVTALTDDDLDVPIENLYDESAAPSVSQARMNAFGKALWAVYDLHQIWRSLGPRLRPVSKTHKKPGRNDPCWCGSGKKFKKCHGA